MRRGPAVLEALAPARDEGRAQAVPSGDDRALPRAHGRGQPLPAPRACAQPALLPPLGAHGAKGAAMRKLVVVLAALAALAAPASAAAHPLGNFTVNRFSRVEVSGPRLYVRYVLDLAEIPTFQTGRIDKRTFARRIARHVHLSIDGRSAALTPLRTKLAHPSGAGGLRTTRLELVLAGPLLDGRSRVAYRD